MKGSPMGLPFLSNVIIGIDEAVPILKAPLCIFLDYKLAKSLKCHFLGLNKRILIKNRLKSNALL